MTVKQQPKRSGPTVTITLTSDMLTIIRRHMKRYGTESVGITNTLRMILHQHSERENFPPPTPVIGRRPRRKEK